MTEYGRRTSGGSSPTWPVSPGECGGLAGRCPSGPSWENRPPEPVSQPGAATVEAHSCSLFPSLDAFPPGCWVGRAEFPGGWGGVGCPQGWGVRVWCPRQQWRSGGPDLRLLRGSLGCRQVLADAHRRGLVTARNPFRLTPAREMALSSADPLLTVAVPSQLWSGWSDLRREFLGFSSRSWVSFVGKLSHVMDDT